MDDVESARECTSYQSEQFSTRRMSPSRRHRCKGWFRQGQLVRMGEAFSFRRLQPAAPRTLQVTPGNAGCNLLVCGSTTNSSFALYSPSRDYLPTYREAQSYAFRCHSMPRGHRPLDPLYASAALPRCCSLLLQEICRGSAEESRLFRRHGTSYEESALPPLHPPGVFPYFDDRQVQQGDVPAQGSRDLVRGRTA